MASITSIALSGLHAAQSQLDSSAHNIANQSTPGFRRQEVLQSAQAEGGVATRLRNSPQEGADLAQDVVTQLQAKHAYLANLAVFKTQDRLAGALLDERG